MWAQDELSDLILKINNNILYVEVGVLRATNIVNLVDMCPNIEKVIGIDPYEEYTDTMHGYYVPKGVSEYNKSIALKKINNSLHKEKIELRFEYSDEACKKFADNSIDVVFLDMSFDCESYKKDVINWLPKVKVGGFISGHEWIENDVQEAIIAVSEELGLISNLVGGDNVWFLKKD